MGKCGPNKYRSKRRLYFNTVKKDNSQELKARIKQLEDRCDKLCKNIDGKNERLGALTSEIGQLESDRKEVFDLSHTIALANIDDRLVDPINRIAKLSKDLEGKE